MSLVEKRGNYLTRKHGISCGYCHRSVSSQLRFKCAECADFDLCHDCFLSGVELHPHVNTHAYRVVDCLEAIHLFTRDWSAAEELLLLDAIDKFGPGNWKVSLVL